MGARAAIRPAARQRACLDDRADAAPRDRRHQDARREVLSADGAEFELPGQSTLAPAEARLDLPAIARALAELDDGPRRAILHAYLDGMSYQEIGAALGIPIGTAKTWVSRGIARLRRSLDGDS